MEEGRCKECEARNWEHDPKCSLMDGEYAKKSLIRYYEAWLEIEIKHRKYIDSLSKSYQRIKKETELWRSKFIVVKNENNKLRQKISKQFKSK